MSVLRTNTQTAKLGLSADQVAWVALFPYVFYFVIDLCTKFPPSVLLFEDLGILFQGSPTTLHLKVKTHVT